MIKTIKKYIIFGIIVISLILSEIKVTAAEADFTLNALSAVLYDGSGGRVLYGKNEDSIMPMASTTKIMTLVIAIEYGNLDDVVTFSKYASMQPDVQMDAAAGEQYYLRDLLYVMMMQSYNDVAVAIAEYIADIYTNQKQDAKVVAARETEESKEAVKVFAGLMNDKAKTLGCVNTYFITPNGLDAEDEKGVHSTTATELAKISAYAIGIELVEEICTTKSYSFSEINNKRHVNVGTTNRFLDMMTGAVGLKTGFTNDAGYCYVGAIKRDGKVLISVVLGCGWPPNKNYKWQDTKALMNYGINNYFYQKVFVADDNYVKIPVVDGVEDSVNTHIPFSLNLILSENEKVDVIYRTKDCLRAPVMKNEEVGMVQIYIDGELFRAFSILSDKNVKKKDFLWHFLNILKEISL